MTYALAFYTGQGNWKDSVIRWVTRSPYSHVELVDTMAVENGKTRCYSSSPRDGGVRVTWIDLDSGHWQIVPVQFDLAVDVWPFWYGQLDKRYDWFGILFSQFLNWRRNSKNRWFCSEIIAHAMGLPNPASYSPGDLWAMVHWLNVRMANNVPV